jgi:superfamily II DNA or RNA helicase
VRDAIARAVLGDAASEGVTLGAIELRPHQVEALARVRSAIAEFGGALLADEPGLGKTFVALALAREYRAAVVAAPAALRTMWREAAATAHVAVMFVSLESLSLRDARARADLVIVDEAHHANNPAASRYARLARLVTGAHALLLTATPVRNRRGELDALLALFLGPRARTLDDPTRARLVLRRPATANAMPAIVGPIWHKPLRSPGIAALLRALPAPLPARDGTEARALVAMTLARCWASSVAALDAALRRRLLRGAALDDALQAGRLPTRAELRGWLIGDDAVQLAFPAFVPAVASDAATMRAVLERHLDAVRALRTRIASHIAPDIRLRARLLERLVLQHAGARVIAFAAHAATAEALYGAMRRSRGVVLLTARGARSAGGSRPRSDVLDALSPFPSTRRHRADGITLVISTDVLNEGVNLQGASVVVHLDLPWTPAALDQRVGRVARIGSAYDAVHVHGFSPPPGAERLLALGRRYCTKNAARELASRPARDAEWVRNWVRPWRNGSLSRPDAGEACVRGSACGFVAVVRTEGVAMLVAGLSGRTRWRVSDAPNAVRRLLERCGGNECVAGGRHRTAARAALERWLDARRARSSAGLDGGSSSAARRRVLARLDDLLRLAPPHAKAALERRVDRVREAITRCSGVSSESALHCLAADAAASGTAAGTARSRWLENLEAFCTEFQRRRDPRPSAQTLPQGIATPVVESILLIVP